MTEKEIWDKKIIGRRDFMKRVGWGLGALAATELLPGVIKSQEQNNLAPLEQEQTQVKFGRDKANECFNVILHEPNYLSLIPTIMAVRGRYAADPSIDIKRITQSDRYKNIGDASRTRLVKDALANKIKTGEKMAIELDEALKINLSTDGEQVIRRNKQDWIDKKYYQEVITDLGQINYPPNIKNDGEANLFQSDVSWMMAKYGDDRIGGKSFYEKRRVESGCDEFLQKLENEGNARCKYKTDYPNFNCENFKDKYGICAFLLSKSVTSRSPAMFDSFKESLDALRQIFSEPGLSKLDEWREIQNAFDYGGDSTK